jgi:putative nucleotidyltransferase with HDIG domain
MAGWFSKIGDRHSVIYRGILFTVAIALLVYLLPSEVRFDQDYELEKPWEHEDLIAPFKFTVLKSDDRLEKDQKEVVESVIPYYNFNPNTAIVKHKLFKNMLQNNWDDCEFSKAKTKKFSMKDLLGRKAEKEDSINKAYHLEVGFRIVEELFEKGIIEIDDLHEDKSPDEEVRLLENNIERKKRRKGNDGREYEVNYSFRDFHDLSGASAEAERNLRKFDNIDNSFLLRIIENVLEYNVKYEKGKTLLEQEEKKSDISRTERVIEKGTTIIRTGDIVDQDIYQQLVSLEGEYNKRAAGLKDGWMIWLGKAVVVLLCIIALILYLNVFRHDITANNRKVTFLLLLLVTVTLLTKVAIDIDNVHVYLAPICLLPVIVRAFFDFRLALFLHLITVLINSFLVQDQFEFLFLHLISGTLLLFSIVSLRKRSQFFLSIFILFVCYSAAYYGVTIIHEGKLEAIDETMFAWFAGNGALVMLAYPLIYIFEKVFGFISEITLMELSDTNSPLLRQLAEKAPGTFQHSMQVANLSEEAIRELGGNPLLVRTGALYHDIGKMKDPVYFIENQSGVNPHNELPYVDSARIIVNHVIDGIEMAKKHNLPEQIVDFIRTHHGTSRTEYFYRMYVKENPDEEVDDNMFRYPGPLPYSKETAVLMMADSVEAASKSLKTYTADVIDALVENIINSQIKADQFVNADITFKDITRIKKMFKRKLMNIYHVRIEYPDQ